MVTRVALIMITELEIKGNIRILNFILKNLIQSDR